MYSDTKTNYIYGAEYQTANHPGTIPESANQQNVPCARCLAARSSVMMLPARRDCPPGWTREYHGKDNHIHKILSEVKVLNGQVRIKIGPYLWKRDSLR